MSGNLEDIWREKWCAGTLEVPQCDGCGAWNWYPLPVCRRCRDTAFTWKEVPPLATLYSWTKVHRAFAGGISTPYVVGLVEMTYAPGVRVACRIREDERTAPIIGVTGQLVSIATPQSWCWEFQAT